MTDNRRGGIALIIGAISGIITMVLHPVSGGGGGHVVTPAQFEKLAALMTGVHVLAIAGIPFLFLGALALSRHLEMGGRLALAGLVIYSLGLVAVMIAPAMSGLVGTQILRKTSAPGLGSEQWRLLMEYNFLINQAFAKIYVMSSCGAIGLWSFLIVKGRMLPLWLGVYGLFLAPAIVLAMSGGALALDVHGFGLIVFSQATWLIAAAIFLMPAQAHSRAPLG
ncbi:MAG: hypothetical protein ABI883_00710 [Chthoniobacterales bacterium]